MKTFKAYLKLQEELLQLQEASPYDKEFLLRATKIKTFDLRKEDFYTTAYKKEIQFLNTQNNLKNKHLILILLNI